MTVQAGVCKRCAGTDKHASLAEVEKAPAQVPVYGLVGWTTSRVYDSTNVRIGGKPVMSFAGRADNPHEVLLSMVGNSLLKLESLEGRLSSIESKLEKFCEGMKKLFEVAEFLPGVGTEFEKVAERAAENFEKNDQMKMEK